MFSNPFVSMAVISTCALCLTNKTRDGLRLTPPWRLFWGIQMAFIELPSSIGYK